ncbi:Beta-barrel assembly-enhancing protease [Fundidesulfovibrio magnetotacticus]|uniref:Beta-barrel assembly-enhancing protease n=1 Tax=Fundidesulfovibrio magnetotacticus TaxID=2730080 RepID=A0A6V8LU81_9BACT|nr:XrtA/PEP-CTERM system TPR-repeat protein PrsT [Fundidesulfovibrio magnetotacticus]GFK93888.1 Beta-barrel assembly-enhancing protease [Fundidesulfovibrio magnetotacticus]
MVLKVFGLLVVCLCILTGCQGKSREELMLQAQELVQQGNPKGAMVIYKNILEKNPRNLPATLALAEANLLAGNPQQAEAELKSVLADPAGSREIPVVLAKIRMAQGKPADSLDILNPLLNVSPASAAALEAAGNASLMLGDIKEAQGFYVSALALEPGRPLARLGLAESHLHNRQPQLARQELDTLLAAAPKNKSALLLLAQLQALDNDEDGAIATYGLIVNHFPDDAQAAYREAFLRLARRNDVARAEETAARLIQGSPKAPEGYKLKGLAFLAKNEPSLAIEPLLTALKIRPDIDTNLFLAQAYTSTGNLETAVSHLQTALTRNPDLDGPRRMLASIYLKQNRLDEAIAETQKIFAVKPSDEAGQRILAEALIAKRDLDKGLRIITGLVDKGDASSADYLRKGMILAIKGQDAAAEADLRKAVQLGAGVLEPKIYLAAFLASKNRMDEAVDILGSDMGEGPVAALACNAMAKLRLNQGKLDQASELLDKARTLAPSVLTTYYNQAALATAAGKMDRATAAFEAALAVKPDDLRALLGAAACREALGDMAKAQEHLERAAKSKDPRATMQLADFFVRRKDIPKALAILDTNLDASPKSIPLWLLKARLHASTGDDANATNALNRVETINQRVGLLEKAKFAMSRKDPAKAVQLAERLRDMNTNSGDYALPLAEIQELAGQTPAAKTTLENAQKTDPKNPRVLSALAKLEARQGNLDKSLALMDQAIDAGFDPANGHALKGAIMHQAGDKAKAAKEYETALRYQERLTLAMNNLAMIYAEEGQNGAKALELALRAYSQEPDSASVLDTLGYVLLKNGKPREAITALQRAETLGPGNADISKHLTLARELAGENNQ